MRAVWTVFQYIFWTGVVVFIAISALTGISTQDSVSLPIRGFIVRSGSMEPTIMTGDVILVSNDTTPEIGKIVTYTDPENRTVTHRIARAADTDSAEPTEVYVTKGDNNQTEDPYSITQENIIGNYLARLPGLGYLLMQTQSGFGMALLFIIPLLMIIASELFKPEKQTADAA